MKTLALLLPLLLPSLLLAQDNKNAPTNRYVSVANQVLAQAGLPRLPAKAEEMNCYAWSGLSAGIYAVFKLKKERFNDYLAPYLSGMERLTPIPRRLLAPPNTAAPWFQPAGIANGTVFFRGRITRAAPEIFRLYADPKNQKIFLYYTWNNKRTYP